MFDINLTDELHLQKLDALNDEHLQLARTLDSDKLVSGKSGYLYPIELLFRDRRYCDRKYLLNDDIYGSPYAIYSYNNPVGFLEVSKVIDDLKQVYISYAILENYRGLGYASKTLKKVSDMILCDKINDINLISLIISLKNEASKAVAVKAGFLDEGLSLEEYQELGYISYQKRKVM